MSSNNGAILLALGIAILADIQGAIAMPTRTQPLTIADETKPVHELNALDQDVYLKNPYLELDPNIQTDNTLPSAAPGDVVEESQDLENNEETKGRDQLPPLILTRQPLRDLLADFFDKLDIEREFREILLNPVNWVIESPHELVLPSRPAQKPLLTPSKIEDQVIFNDKNQSKEVIKDDSNEYDDFEEGPPVDMSSDEANEQLQDNNQEKTSSDENLLNDPIDEEKEYQNTDVQIDIPDVNINPEADDPPNEDKDPSKLGLDEEMTQDEDFELKPTASPGTNLDIVDVDPNPEADEPPNEDEDPSKLGLDDELIQDEDFELKPTASPGTNLDIVDVDPNPEADEPPNEDEDPSKLGLDDEMIQDEDFELKPTASPGTNLDIVDVDQNPEADEPPNEDEDPSKLGLDDAPIENQTIPDTEQTTGSKDDKNSDILKETNLQPFLGDPEKTNQNQHLDPDRIIFPIGDLF
ncbi:hypothetical protein B566_EDAN005522 [Ephemera danica]|nr:hypothetical protein B566_EDAN005522 [Ephemera danica]